MIIPAASRSSAESQMRAFMLRKTAKETLTQALRTTKLGLPARVIFLRLPALRDVTEAMAWYFTDRLTFPRDAWNTDHRPLLHVCLQHAFQRAEAAFEESDSPDPNAVAAAYLGGLFYVAHFAQNVSVSSPDGELWNPMAGPPLSEWASRFPSIDVDAETTPDRPLLAPASARMALLTKLASGSTLAALGALLTKVYDQEASQS